MLTGACVVMICCTGAVPATGPIPNIVGTSDGCVVGTVEVGVEVDVEVVVEVEVEAGVVAVALGPLAIGFTVFVMSALEVTRNCLASEACPFNSLALTECSDPRLDGFSCPSTADASSFPKELVELLALGELIVGFASVCSGSVLWVAEIILL